MEKIILFIKKYKIFIFLFLVLLVLIILKFSFQKPKLPEDQEKQPRPLEKEKPTFLEEEAPKPPFPEDLPSLPPIKKPEIKKETINKYKVQNIVFIGQLPNFPANLSVFEVEKEGIKAKCQQIAQKLDLKLIPLPPGEENNPVEIWAKNNLSLSCDQIKNRIEVSNPSYSEEKPSLENAKKSAQDYMNNIGVPLDGFELKKENIEYHKIASLSYFPSSPEEADIINLKYKKIVNSFPIFQSYGDIFALEIFVGSKNSVVKLKYFPLFDRAKEKDVYPLINIDQAVAELNQGKGELISLEYIVEDSPGYYEEIPLKISGTKSANLNHVRLVYFYSSENNLLIPSYIFSGNGIASDNRKISLTILIPVLPSQYLNP